MKKLSLTLLTLIFFTTMSMASNTKGHPEEKLRDQVIGLLETPDIKLNEERTEAKIYFTLNKKSEIVILSVDTNNKMLDTYIKRKLNYRKTQLNNVKSGKNYNINYTIIKGII